MKGLMVTLLVFTMTGTVFSQQSNPQTSLASQAESRFTLTLTDEYIERLRENQAGLKADVFSQVKQGKLHEVFLRYENDSQNMDNHDAIDSHPNRYNVWIDETRIRLLKTNKDGLVAEVPSPLNDVIKQILLVYQPPTENVSVRRTSPTPEPDGGFASRMDNDFASNSSTRFPSSQNNRFGDRSPTFGEQIERIKQSSNIQSTSQTLYGPRFHDEDDRYPSPGPIENTSIAQQYPTENRSTFTQPTQFENNRTNQNNSGFDRSQYTYQEPNPGFRPRVSTNDQVANYSNRQTYSPTYPKGVSELNDLPIRGPVANSSQSVNPNSQIELQAELLRRETQRLREQREEEARQLAQQKLDAQKAQLRNEMYLQELQKQSRANIANDNIAPIQPGYQAPRYASNNQNIIQNPSYQFPNRRQETFNQVANTYDYNRPPATTQPTTQIPPRRKFSTPPRIAQQNGIRNYATSIPATSKNTDVQVGGGNTDPKILAQDQIHAEKVSRFMFFMLMFSIGLNLYLAWIARGFYFRYNELADELRETFTSSS